jgi:hypothetical protein
MQEFEYRPHQQNQPAEAQSSPESEAATLARLMQEEIFDPMNETPTSEDATVVPLQRMMELQSLIATKNSGSEATKVRKLP